MYGRQRQSEHQRALNIARARQEALLREIREDTSWRIEKIREQTFSEAYTALERAFGFQPEQTLLNLDKGVRDVLGQVDRMYMKDIEHKFLANLKAGRVMRLRKQDWSNPTEDDLKFVQAIRDELIDVFAQFIEQALKRKETEVKLWVSQLATRPDLQPREIVRWVENQIRVTYSRSGRAKIEKSPSAV